MSTIFSKIINKEIPADIVYEDDSCLAFADIAPVAPVHILIIPKRTDLPTLNDLRETDEQLLGHMVIVAQKIAEQFNIANSGWRLVCNVNGDAGQVVYHIHFHVLGGNKLNSIG